MDLREHKTAVRHVTKHVKEPCRNYQIVTRDAFRRSAVVTSSTSAFYKSESRNYDMAWTHPNMEMKGGEIINTVSGDQDDLQLTIAQKQTTHY